MTAKTQGSLPSIAPYPEAAWISHITPEVWNACIDSWINILEAHLRLPDSDFKHQSCKDESIWKFLTSYMGQSALSEDTTIVKDPVKAKILRRNVFFLSSRILQAEPPIILLSWTFMSDFSKVYGKIHASKVISSIWPKNAKELEKSLSVLKLHLIKELEAGLKGDPAALEAQLRRLNHFINASWDAAAFFMTGSDFIDGLVSCYKLMNPPLRSAILSTTYLCIIGLTEGEKPRLTLLTEQLYSLKASAEVHKAGPLNERESLVAELVTTPPVIRQLQRIDPDVPGASRVKTVVTALEAFRKGPGDGKGGSIRPKRLVKRKVDKGKGVTTHTDDYSHNAMSEIHVHRMSLISQIRDLFPDLGEGFIIKLLDEYSGNVEEVISHLLEDSLPPHLQQADRSEPILPSQQQPAIPDLAPRGTPPLLPTRRNVFDDDEFDRLEISADRLHFGKRNPGKTAESLLSDKSSAPGAAAILSALAAFDSDDDERDDTYDVEDVGGTVDSAAPGGVRGEGISNKEEQEVNVHEEALFRAYKLDVKTFNRDAATRRSPARGSLRTETNMTDEAIEGWALMLSRDPRRLRRLEAKFESFAGQQSQLAGSRWQNNTDTEDSGAEGPSRGGFRGRGRGGRGRGGGGNRGNVAGPTGDKETERARNNKEANKGSRANHNRRDQRARKMARGGFPG